MATPQELLNNQPPDQHIPTSCAVLSYEVGDLIKTALNIHWGSVRGYQGEALLALGDAITMLRLLAAHLNIDFSMALQMGEDRYMSRESIDETRKDGIVRPE